MQSKGKQRQNRGAAAGCGESVSSKTGPRPKIVIGGESLFISLYKYISLIL